MSDEQENEKTELEKEKINNSILDHIILGVAHEINNPNAFVRMNMMNIKKMFNLLRPALEEYSGNHPDAKFGPYNMTELRSKLSQLIESTLGATVRIITVADKLKQCTSFALSQSDEVNMAQIVNNVVNMHQFLIDHLETMEFNYDQDESYTFVGHHLQLEQALSILLTNACDAINEKYKGQEGKHGSLILTLEKDDKNIILSFKDDGSGIDQEIMEKIFTPYFTTKPQGVGDGMGLPLCQAILERHNGKIAVESQKGVGTTMSVVIPVDQE